MPADTSTRPLSFDDERTRTLRRLLPLWPHEIADRSVAGQRRICRLLGTALRRERQRGAAGHWTYDLVRHRALAHATPVEQRRLATMLAGLAGNAWATIIQHNDDPAPASAAAAPVSVPDGCPGPMRQVDASVQCPG